MCREILRRDCTLQTLSHIFRENIRISCRGCIVCKRLQNRHKIPDGDALLQQILQHLLNLAESKQLRYKLFHKGGIGLLEIVYQILYILTRQQLCDILSDDLCQMRCNDGGRVNNSISKTFRSLPLPLCDPDGRQMEGRFKRRNTRDLLLDIAGVHRHVMVKEDFSLTDLNPLDLNNVLIWIQLNIISQTDDRYNRT